MQCEAKPYDGQEPYLFVTYAHRDAEKVFPAIERLTSDGFRVWFDEGIDPGSEWVTNIAEHLHAAAAVVAFISHNSIASHNCREEILFARDQGIPVLAVYLEDVKLDHGLRLALTSYQAIFMQKYDEVEDCYAKIERADVLFECRAEKANEPSVPESQGTPREMSLQNEEQEASPEPPLEAERKEVPREQPRDAVERARHEPFRKRVVLLIAAIAAAAICVCVIFALVNGGSSNPTETTTLENDVEAEEAASTDSAAESSSTLSYGIVGLVEEADVSQDIVTEPFDDISTLLLDPDAYRGETIEALAYYNKSVFHSELTTSNYTEYILGEDPLEITLMPYEEDIWLPESEQEAITQIAETPFFSIRGKVETVDGSAYLDEAIVTPASYFSVMSPAFARWDDLGALDQSGISISVDAVCFAEAETRIWFTVSNNRSTPISFASPVVVQNGVTIDTTGGVTQGKLLSTSVSANETVSGYIACDPLAQDAFSIEISGFSTSQLQDLSFSFEVSKP